MQSLRLRINSRTQGPIKLHPSKMHNYCKSCFTSQKCAVPANWTIQGRKMQTYVWCRATCNLQLATCKVPAQGAAPFMPYIYFACAPCLQIACACPCLILIRCRCKAQSAASFVSFLHVAAAPCLHVAATHKCIPLTILENVFV